MRRRTFLLLLFCYCGCRGDGVVTASYNNLGEAREAGAVKSGRMPDGLPSGTTDLREAFSDATGERWGLFNFPTAESAQLKALLEPAEHSLAGEQCNPPRRIEWWPIILRGELDPERIAVAGLTAYKSRDERLVIVVNWKQGRAYYWSARK